MRAAGLLGFQFTEPLALTDRLIGARRQSADAVTPKLRDATHSAGTAADASRPADAAALTDRKKENEPMSIDDMAAGLLGQFGKGAATKKLAKAIEGPKATKIATAHMKAAKAKKSAKAMKIATETMKVAKCMKAAKVKGAGAKAHGKTGGAKCKLPFPGVPKKAAVPFTYKDVSIYTDLNGKNWRVKQTGVREDRKASWNADPRAAWSKVLSIVNEMA